MTLQLPEKNPGIRITSEPMSRSTLKAKCQTYLHFLFQLIVLIVAAGLVYYSLLLGRTFLPDEWDYHTNPHHPLLRPPGPQEEGEKEEKE